MMTMQNGYRLAFIVLAAAALAACGGGGSGSSTAVSTTPTSTSPAAHFGAQFATDFNAPANSTPAKVQAGDIIPLDLTAPPYALH
jgi:hypothetical protein